MSWGTALQYVKSILNKDESAAENKSAPQVFVPFNASVGGLINIQKSAFIRAEIAGSLIDAPTDSETIIAAISRVKFEGSDAKVFRIYLDTGDDGDGEKFLQVLTGEDSDIREILFCSSLLRFVPESKEDQEAFTGTAGYGLGEGRYTLYAEQLADVVDEKTMKALFSESEELTYERDTGDDLDTFFKPFYGSESRLDDTQGMLGLKQEVYYMPYVRELGDSKEFLLITTEVVNSRDGDQTRREIHVDFMIGIPVSDDRILIQ